MLNHLVLVCDAVWTFDNVTLLPRLTACTAINMCMSNGFWIPVLSGTSYTFEGTVRITAATVDSIGPVPPAGPYTPGSDQTFSGNVYAFGKDSTTLSACKNNPC